MAETIRLDGKLISLTAFHPGDVERVAHGLGRLDPVAAPDRNLHPDVLRRRLERSGRFWRGSLDAAIRTRRERLVGLVQARRRPAQSLPPGVVSIGVVVFDPRDRGRGYGREATGLLTEWLLGSGTERVQAETGMGNAPMRAVLERLGFVLEGVLRAFALGDGGREDVAMYAVVSAPR
jgi:RimJ/RimL family protein N-acetyltransferase